MRQRRRTALAVSAILTVGAGLLAAIAATPAAAAPGTVVISQVYGGGGNTGAPLTHDFVELFNRSPAPAPIDGWSLQYASSAGLFSQKVTLSGTLPPGGYHLIQLAAGAGSGSPPPPADTTGSIPMSATAAKVALATSDTLLNCGSAAVPCSPEQLTSLADLVGYGGANLFEGSTAAPTLSNGTAALRGGHGCDDTDSNGADFDSGAPAPRNSGTAAAPCGGEPTPAPTPTADPCESAATHEIAQVQGQGNASPLAGQSVRVEGVVTADFQGPGQIGGVFIQDATPDADQTTSDGLFVFSARPAAVGDRVLVSGKAVEFNRLTELTDVAAVDVCGTGTITAQPYELPRVDSLERVEGVLLTFPERLTVTELFQLGEFGTFAVSSEGRLYQPRDGHGATQELNDRRKLLVDDASTRRNPRPLPYPIARMGDTITGLTGVLSFGFDAFRVQPTQPPVFAPSPNPRPVAPAPVGGTVRVASFNTLNWFTTVGSRGATTVEERDRQLAKLVSALKGLDADVVGLMEVENNGDTAVGALVAALNAEVGAGTYAWVRHPNPGTDLIHVAVIYKAKRVRPVEAARSSADPIFERPPLVQTFMRRPGGHPFTVIINHFKSKRCDGATGDDLDTGQGCFNARRVKQANAVLALSLEVPHPVVLGDLNAYTEEDPVLALTGGGLVGLTERHVPAADRYSFVFDGQAGELDHFLAGRSLARRVTGAAIWHINADESSLLDYNTESKPEGIYQPDAYRSSDHDPVVIGLNLP